MQTLLQDLRFGARMLIKRPGFTLIAVCTLALGIGANTAIFSLIDAVLLRPLAYAKPDQLVMVWEDATAIGFPRDTPAPANYFDWKTQNQVFQDVAALDQRSFNLTGEGEPEKLQAYGVTANLLPLLGVTPALGRNFLPAEDKPGAAKVALLSHQFWQSRYGGEGSIIGRDILLNGEKYSVIGVLPRGFQFGERYVRVWVPLGFSPSDLTNRGNHFLQVVARLKPGVTVSQADADIKAITQRIAQQYPNDAAGLSSAVVSFREEFTGEVQKPLLMLVVAVGFVLLIACANIASLLLARAAARQREIAVRAALGAGRFRLVRQFLTESVLLAGGGGVLGVLFAVWSFEFLQRLIPPSLVLQANLQLNPRVLLFTLAAALLAGVLFGLVPALQASRVNLNDALKQGGGRAGFSGGQRHFRHALVVGEVALALVLLIGAGLLLQTLYHLHGQYSMLQPASVLTARTVLPDYKYGEHAQRVQFYTQVLERVRALPGVVSAGYTTSVPLEWKGGANGLSLEGKPNGPGASWNANHRQVTENYLQTLGLALRSGRYFSAQDDEQAQPVVIVNETMAQKYWPGEEPLGKRFKLGGPDSKQPWLTIVGVVADVRQMGMDVAVKPEAYYPQRQIKSHAFFTPRDLVVRTSVEPLTLAAAVRTAIHAVDPEQPVANLQPLSETLNSESAMRRTGMTLLVAFAVLALLLASLGLYGVLSYFVTQHTPEIGVRMALGARPGDVLRLILRQGMTLVLGGIATGLLSALALTRLMKSLVFGIGATDPLTFVLVPLLLCAVALLACWLPARRATQVDPLVALRNE